MRILIATPFMSQHFDAGLFWVKAFCNLGHSVYLWDYRIQKEMPLIDRPDLTIVFKGESVNPESLPRPRYCYWPDALDRTPGIENILQRYDRVYTPVRPTPQDFIWMPSGFDPAIHKYYNNNIKVSDCIYIGTANSDRKREFIKVIGPDVVYGNNWRESQGNFIRLMNPVYLHDFVQVANSAKVLVNVHQGFVGLNRKFFECIACGFTITDLVPGVAEILGQELAELVGFNSPEEGRELKDKWLKSNPEEREKVWQMEKDNIAGYTYLECAIKMLE